MWKMPRRNKPKTEDERKVRNINVWSFVLVAFIVVWVAGAYLYLNKKTEISMNVPPVIVLDEASGIDMDGFFKMAETNKQLLAALPKTNGVPSRPMFEIKDSYNVGDVIVVKFFYVEAVVIDKGGIDSYTILYKDHNHVLQKLILPRAMLMAPSEGVLNPVSLLVD